MRLASGQKHIVDKKSMRKLTVKNYERLPEVLKKKQDAEKLELHKATKEKAAAY
jgi:TfoX/Sxy family transcriptional regulator of competence genes